MTAGLTEKKRLSMLKELTHWHVKRKSFTLLQGFVLCGSFEFWALTSPWIRFIYHQLRFSVNKCLANCSLITKNKTEIKKLISEVANTKDSIHHELKDRFLVKTIAKETYKCEHKTYIDTSMRSEPNMMYEALTFTIWQLQ